MAVEARVRLVLFFLAFGNFPNHNKMLQLSS